MSVRRDIFQRTISFFVRWCCVALRHGTGPLTTHFRLQRQIRGCIRCGRIFLPGEPFRTCGLCRDNHDLCVSCHRRHQRHREAAAAAEAHRSSRAPLSTHPMYAEAWTPDCRRNRHQFHCSQFPAPPPPTART